MKFVLLFGPQAVGKMTVGQELAKITGLKLFHNHMTIDLLEPLYGFSEEMWRLTHLFREEIFKSFSASHHYGMIFTYVWAFDQQKDWDAVENMSAIFSAQGADTYFVELEADMDVRLDRNKTPHRLQNKPTKRNLEQSEQHLKSTMKKLRLNSYPGEIEQENYLRLNNEQLTPEIAAQMIKEHFNL
ncbi:AAA family ATPase [Halobacillus rhizosphaerae]|uniref:AAA family ATPase n=1 Tax=Halobacillus rhizosphaerae TaxID=3064889 RepID=UPI00398BB723